MSSPENPSDPTTQGAEAAQTTTATATATPEASAPQPEQPTEEAISWQEAMASISGYLRQRGVEKVTVLTPPQTKNLKDILKTMVMQQKARNFIDPTKQKEQYDELTAEIDKAKREAKELVAHMAGIKNPDGELRFEKEYIELLQHFIEQPEDALMDSPRRSFWKNMQREQIDKTAAAELDSNTPDVKLADFINGNNQGSFYFRGRESKKLRGIDPLTGKPIWDDNTLVHYINGHAARDTFEAMNMENALRPDMRCDFLFLRQSEMRGKGISCLWRKRAALEEANEALILSNGKVEKIYGRHARLAGKGDMAVMDRIAQNAFLMLKTDQREYLIDIIKQRMSAEDQQKAKMFLAQQEAYKKWKEKSPNREPNRDELVEIGNQANQMIENGEIELFPDDPEKFVFTSEMLFSVEIDRSVENRTGFGMLILTEIQNAESPDDEVAGQYQRIRGCDEMGYNLKNRIFCGGDSARAAADTGRKRRWAYNEAIEVTPLTTHLQRIQEGSVKDLEALEQRKKRAAEADLEEKKKSAEQKAKEKREADQAALEGGEGI